MFQTAGPMICIKIFEPALASVKLAMCGVEPA
jgi:hypothetical protein